MSRDCYWSQRSSSGIKEDTEELTDKIKLLVNETVAKIETSANRLAGISFPDSDHPDKLSGLLLFTLPEDCCGCPRENGVGLNLKNSVT